jgi:hypothetical protein
MHVINSGTTQKERYWNINNIKNNEEIFSWDIKEAGLDVDTDTTKYINMA